MGTQEVRLAASGVQQAAEEVRRLAARAVDAGAAGWRSPAAGRFRDRLAEEVARLHRTAGLLEDAAAALRRHADAVEAAWDGAAGTVLRAARGVLA